MRKILLGIFITLFIILVFKQCQNYNQNKTVVKEHSALIQESLKNVGKLVVTEGHFSEVLDYKNSKEIFSDYFTAEKKAIVIVNAKVTVGYDLSKIEYIIDEENKTISLIKIPKEEINISPDLEYYDMKSDFLNPFEAKDYNAIKETVNQSLMKKVEASNIKTNARNRLISELSKLYILTNSLGWKLQYNQTPIDKLNVFENLKL